MAQVGQTFTITFGVDDGINPAVTQDVDIDVIAFNAPPVLNPIPTPQAVVQGANLAFQITATDPVDPITLTAIPLPANATFVDNGNGNGDFDFTPDFVQAGRFDVTFAASDGINPPVSQVVRIDVSGNGFGTFTEVTPAVNYSTNGFGLDSADLDGDGNVDLAAADYDLGGGGGTAGLVIMIGDGAGGFAVTAESPYSMPGASADPQPRHVLLGDFDNDGGIDAAIAPLADGDVHVYLGDMPGGFPDGTFTNYAAGLIDLAADQTHHLYAGDLNADGNLDVTVTAFGGGNLNVLIGNGTGAFTFSTQSPLDTATAGGGIVHAVIADINADGIPDIVSSNFQDDIMRVFMGDDDGTGVNGNVTFTLAPGSVTTPVVNPGLPTIADYNRDGFLDVALPHFQAAAVVTIWLGDGTGAFTEATARPSVGDSAEYATSGDFNADGIPDLAVSAVRSDELYVFLGVGDGTFNPTTGSPFALSDAGRVVIADDFNNDGRADLAVATEPTGNLHVFLGN